jgi:hypothetical protein
MVANSNLSDIFPLPHEARKLQAFVGDWDVEGVLTTEGRSFKVTGQRKFASAAAGWGVFNVGKMEIEGLGTYEELHVLGFDPSEKTFHYFSVTNTASARDHKGKWIDDRTISFLYEGSQKGKDYREEIEVKIQTPKELKIIETDTLAGNIILTMDTTLKKQT